MIRDRIPDVVVRRLVGYLGILKEMRAGADDFVSSASLGHLSAVNSAQVRKDLALFGEFGKQGVGYPVAGLIDELTTILDADREMPVSVIGIGELGTALVRFLWDRKASDPTYRFVVRALFDESKQKINTKVEGLTVNPISQLPKLVESQNLKIGIIAVPAVAAQQVVDFAMDCGIRGFLNFAPVKLRVRPGVRLHHADVTFQLQELSFYL